jgi:tripeptidyl-peptidase-1
MFSVKSFGVLVLGFAATCHAGAVMKQVESVEKSALEARGWTVAENSLSSDQQITLEIGLTLQNTDQLISKLLDVSTPKSKNYGKWLTKEAAENLVKPTTEANTAVVNWLKNEGVTQLQSDGTWVRFVANIETANRLLAADFQQYGRDGIKKIRTTSYSVPEDLHQHIDIIHPTTFFGQTAAYAPKYIPRPRTVRRSPAVERRQLLPYGYGPPPSPPQPARTGQVRADRPYFKVNSKCNSGITPVCVRQLYNVGNYTGTPTSGSKLAFGSFLNQSYQYEDLRLFQKAFKLPYENATKIFVNNATNSQDPAVAGPNAGEANLDVQNMVGLAHGLPIYEFLTGGSPPFIPDLEMKTPAQNTNEPYVPYYQFLLSLTNEQLPSVISNSYGEPEQTVPQRYAERTCNMVAQLTIRGVSIFESSGDTGVGSYCAKNDGTNAPTFLPEFPSSCPWITSVGGTQGVSPEVAWDDSSGGFSYYFPRPDYQREAVEAVSYVSKFKRFCIDK